MTGVSRPAGLGTPSWSIAYEASPAVREAISRLGRTEDIACSPSGRLLAIASFAKNAITLVTLADPTRHDGRLVLSAASEVSAPQLRYPHGLAFLGEDALIVANRQGELVVFRLSRGATRGEIALRHLSAEPGRGFRHLASPGSVRAVQLTDTEFEVLVCNNSGHTVTCHRLSLRDDQIVVSHNVVLLNRWLHVPDGVARSSDGRWLAVSNHTQRVVMLHALSGATQPSTRPSAVLRGVSYPHGMGFVPDGSVLFVADAGSPNVHAFRRPGDTWAGVQYPAGSFRVMDDASFERIANPQEGGPKGIDIDPSGGSLVITSETLPLVFLDVAALVEETSSTPPSPENQVQYELDVMEQTANAWNRALRLEQSRSYRMTAALRWLHRTAARAAHEIAGGMRGRDA